MKYESREIAYLRMQRIGRPRHVVEVGACGPDQIRLREAWWQAYAEIFPS